MAKNIQSLQLLRNTSQLYATREAALAALTGSTIPAGAQDGTPVLARYKGEDGSIMTLVGYYAVASAITGSDTATTHMTVFDFEGSKADVEALREEINAKLGEGVTSTNTATAQLTALSGNGSSTSADTSVEGAKRYADEKVRAALDALDATTQSGESKVIIDVTQDNGKITTSSANLTGVKLDGYTVGGDDSGKIADTDTLGAALGKLQGQINGMDKEASSANGEVVITVVETDGKVTEEKSKLKDVLLTGYAKTNDTGDIAATDSVNVALNKLENKAAAITIKNDDGSINVTSGADGTNINVNIKSGEKVIKKDGNGGLYTDLDLVKITTGLPTTIKERYQLLASDDSQIGANIDIYKDSSISKIYLGYSDDTVNEDTGVITSGTTGEPQSLNYVYHKEDGKYEMVHVDVSKFLVESEFASGVTADATGVVHGVVDANSETNSGGTAFLTVDADGFKVNGIKQEIIDRINELDADLSGNTTHVKVGVAEADGKITAVTVDETDIASKSLLDELSGKAVTAVAMTGGTANIVDNDSDGTKKITINTDGSQIFMTGYAKGSDSGAVDTSDSINVAIGKLENQIAGKVDALDATVSGETTDGKVNVKVTETNGVITAVDVVGTDIASASALTAEITARKAVDGVNGNAYTADANAHYISGASSLYGADQALDTALNTVDNAMLTGVVAGNGITVSDKNGKSQTISAKVKNDDGIVNDADGLHLGTIDCGTY